MSNRPEIEYPYDMQIKVVGYGSPTFESQVEEVAARHGSTIKPDSDLRQHQSRTGKYRSLSFVFHAQSREHLDALYRDLESCDQVLWLL
ncbi:YbeD family protein [Thiofilum flexile]|uniref:YbeD family protein n=1 Tax=Thiofilum flexile TaxID=125627 RepID=UPI00035E230F|nr:DUF493 domain-containing protein [Thiofilum flexile]